jgi:hypothetical protein
MGDSLDVGTSLRWSASRTEENARSTHWIGDWLGPRAGVDDVEINVEPTGTRTPTPRSSIPTALSINGQEPQ